LSAKKSKVKVILCQRASPSGFAVPYNFSIALTCGFAFGEERVRTETCFHVEYNPHPALKGLICCLAKSIILLEIL